MFDILAPTSMIAKAIPGAIRQISKLLKTIYTYSLRLDNSIGVMHTFANGYTVKTLQDPCEQTLRQFPEGWVSHQKDLLIALTSLESFLHNLFLSIIAKVYMDLPKKQTLDNRYLAL